MSNHYKISRVLGSQLLQGMDSSTSLSDDILLEIFAHLPLNSIYKFRCLSKVWSSNLSSHNFITQWFQINKKYLPWIHYHTILDPVIRNAYPEPHSEFMSKREHLFSFEFLMDQKPFQEAKLHLLGSSNGLVLCESLHFDGQSRYHVCNPLTQKWVSNKFNVYIFSSDLCVWESFQVSCDENVEWRWSNVSGIVLLNGVLYWVEQRNRMLVYNFNQKNKSDVHRCSLINLPNQVHVGNGFDSILGESEGCVCYARTRITGRNMSVSVWVLNEVNWEILHNEVSIDCVLAEMRSRIGQAVTVGIQVLGFSPVDRDVVLLGCRHVWGVNIKTRSFEELCLDNKPSYPGRMYSPFVLTPMPTVLRTILE